MLARGSKNASVDHDTNHVFGRHYRARKDLDAALAKLQRFAPPKSRASSALYDDLEQGHKPPLD